MEILFRKNICGEYIIEKENFYFFIDFQTRYITIPREYYNIIRSKYMLINENLNEDICFEEVAEYFFYTIY